MKGHILNLLEDFVIEQIGLKSYHQLLSQCSFDTSVGFIRTENYPDEFVYEIVGQVVAHLKITPEAAQIAFGEWVCPHLIKLLPNTQTFSSAPEFLAALDNIHQVELKKLYPDARPPRFVYVSLEDGQGELTYSSPRGLTALLQGVLQGVGRHFGCQIVMTPLDTEGGAWRYRLTFVPQG